ncbi:MAG TPA: iron transporter FeoA [Syntrophus sp. (in: bacteria)]|jgi:ferrous iron transport protein A|nr:iron transporter FeoA [Syntrophus sp. (in: bacteria)]
MNLADLNPGQTGRVLKVSAVGPLKRRLMDMGIVPGAPAGMLKAAPLGDPIEITIKNYRLSLRRGEAEKIEVEIVS